MSSYLTHQQDKSAKLCWISWLYNQLHPALGRTKHVEDNRDGKTDAHPGDIKTTPFILSSLSSLSLWSFVQVSVEIKLPTLVFIALRAAKKVL